MSDNGHPNETMIVSTSVAINAASALVMRLASP